MPTLFESAPEFEQNLKLEDEQEAIKLLQRILKPFMLRRVKREVESKMPPKKELYVFVQLTTLQRKVYRDILTDNIDVINGYADKIQIQNTIM